MASTKSLCCFCRLPRAELECETCHDDVCRSCVERLSEEAMELLSERPPELQHVNFCPRCFQSVVEPAMAAYDETFERAKKVGFWARGYRGHVPVIKKARFGIEVTGGRDRDDVIMRLGFLAAQQGFNGLIQGEVDQKKVRNHGYQKSEWSGRAIPCKVDDEKLERDEFNEAHWRVLHHR